MDAYASLTSQLPELINTHTGAEALSDLEALRDDEDGPGLDVDEVEALESVEALRDALGADWENLTRYGGTLISADSFKDYARDYAEETTDGGSDNPLWPYVDWSAWADALRMDYTEVEVESGEFMGLWLYRD